jgi:hypothetical protein
VLCRADGAKGEAVSGSNREGESTDAERRGGAARSGVEGPVMGPERRGCVVRPWPLANWKQEELVDKAKPFKIPKREVWEAFKRDPACQVALDVVKDRIIVVARLLDANPVVERHISAGAPSYR